MYHAKLGKFVNESYIKNIVLAKPVNKNFIYGYVENDIYYELNIIVDDIDLYVANLETKGCVVYFAKEKKNVRRNSKSS